ncbi:MAG TPA: SUMF1/EgtB/PvdO family nonheme iron enzyme [Candidatus Sulfopaludibacter sp.]|jgi:formylglycine-generating enzyme required for sulfatase activity|nr:SUMF1/EgtB/PvdO family nonheme iron enzyme [Candidatus Sulfopaludibacter sp.]
MAGPANAGSPIFISYSSTDKDAAGQICAYLEQAGLPCWIAPRDIPPGAEYPAAILDGIQRSRSVVVLMTAAAVASPHILSEVGHAFSQKKPIVPFRLSDASLPPDFDYFLSLSQWLDAHDGCTPANLSRLRDAVTRAPLRQGGKAAGLDKRVLLAGLAILLIAAAAILYWRRPAPAIETKTAIVEEKKIPPVETKPQPWVNPKDGLTYVWIPPGTFTMGCSPGDTECKPDEAPSHPVELSAGFWMGQTEVTNAAYRRIVPAAPVYPANEGNLPVVEISRKQAKAYCAAVGGRLPTEAEWEYAARGGVAGAWYGVPARIAWYEANSGGSRHPVGGLQANAFGLYDMLGNAGEWVLDRYYNKYDLDAPATGKVDEPLAGNSTATARGGYWESETQNIRVSHRMQMDPFDTGPMVGIRCVLDRTQ